MSYPPNTVVWTVGSFVLHAADAKRPEMLMRVIGYTPDGRCRTRYATKHPMQGSNSGQIWVNDLSRLLDPKDFGVSLDGGAVNRATALPTHSPHA